eukprot:GHRQ01015110.1.p1 GENE.GHRQ01015110.1~~GHRQ01015110.1.p1  ORF type:complete len:545 (+),score=212.46 GHRQ01015110.1:143-1777(+)
MVAYTVEDASKSQATELELAHKKLRALPAGLVGLEHLLSLDASDNPQLAELQVKQLPPGVTTLSLAGCSLSELPQCLSRLSGLVELQLAANHITQADAVFACPSLRHAGLSFNRISGIETLVGAASNHFCIGSCTSTAAGLTTTAQQSRGSTPVPQRGTPGKHKGGSSSPQPGSAFESCKSSTVVTSTVARPNAFGINASSSSNGSLASIAASSSCSSPLMSLDLSHNDITDLAAVLTQLQQLPALRSLSLKGNPASLAAGYRGAVLQALPQLLYLDGQKLDGINLPTPGSRPGTTGARRRPGSAKPPAAAEAAGGQAAAAGSMAAEAQPVVLALCSMPCAAAAFERTVPLLLRLQLGSQQLAEISEQAFALISVESARRQQQLLQAAAADANDASRYGSTDDNKAENNGSNTTTCQAAESGLGNHTSSTAPLQNAQSAAATPTSSDVAVPAAAAPLKPIAYHVEVLGPDDALMCSTALIIQPPAAAAADVETPPAAAAPADNRKGGAKGKPTSQDTKAAGAAVAKPRPGRSGANVMRMCLTYA